MQPKVPHETKTVLIHCVWRLCGRNNRLVHLHPEMYSNVSQVSVLRCCAQYLAFFLVQLYLNVSQLGPEIFVGCLQGRDERFGLLTLGTPFLGHRGQKLDRLFQCSHWDVTETFRGAPEASQFLLFFILFSDNRPAETWTGETVGFRRTFQCINKWIQKDNCLDHQPKHKTPSSWCRCLSESHVSTWKKMHNRLLSKSVFTIIISVSYDLKGKRAHDEDSGAGVNEFYSTERPLMCLYSKHNTSTHRSAITPVRSSTALETQTVLRHEGKHTSSQTLHHLPLLKKTLQAGNCLWCSLSLWISLRLITACWQKSWSRKQKKLRYCFQPAPPRL